MNVKDLLRIDTSAGPEKVAVKLLLWVLALSVATWIVIGLVSLRFDLQGNFEKVFFSQLIVVGIALVGTVNLYVMSMDGFGASRSKILGYAPLLWSVIVTVAFLMLLWQVWSEFEAANDLLKTMYSLLGIGLCGTYAGLVSLARPNPAQSFLQPVMYVLTAIVGIEVLDAMWLSGVGAKISASSTGESFALVGTAVGFNMAAYAVLAAILNLFPAYRGGAQIVFVIGALFGFMITLAILLDSLDAGPYRFILGACVLLSSASVGLAMLHYQRWKYSQAEPAEPASPTAQDGPPS